MVAIPSRQDVPRLLVVPKAVAGKIKMNAGNAPPPSLDRCPGALALQSYCDFTLMYCILSAR